MNTKEILKKYYGYESFKKGQEELVSGIVSGRDVLGIMPTGAGKSVCFQVPAIYFEGITIVVSPLISLMQDQVMALKELGVPSAYINSSLTPRQIDLALDYARNGKYKLVYVAPERLLTESFLNFATHANISMLTVDEAHCISQWGQDFRPSYLDIPKFIAKLPSRPIVSAFTATATEKVQNDIKERLQLCDPKVLVTGFDRENLFFEVAKPPKKKDAMLSFVSKHKGEVGIIYCFSRKLVEDVCETLNNNGFSASRYHAGLSEGERAKNQNDFLYDRVKIMVATNAFGMGIDKSDVSFVLHYNMPKDLESYYQEAGRAGRDGSPATCTLLYNATDVSNNSWLIENSKDTMGLDYKAQQNIIKQEKARLKIMTDYCKSGKCLRNFILEYFGENRGEPCKNCSVCNSVYESADVSEDAKLIISCVSVLRERFGAGVIKDVLVGSRSKKLKDWRLNECSYYNASDKSGKYIKNVIESLIQNDYLYQSDDSFPLLKITEKGKDFVRFGGNVEMKFAVQEKLSKAEKFRGEKASSKVGMENVSLFEALRDFRMTLAKSKHLPAYVVFSDKTLIEMSEKMPKNKEEMLAISGVGEVKFQRYGEVFLEEIERWNKK